MTSNVLHSETAAAAGIRSPRVSVVIPTHNRASLLMEALKSVFNQTWKDFEVIVVDDGSTDDTAERIRVLTNRIRFLRQPNLGVAAARNHGIRNARGELVCFLDSDDIWMPNKLEKQITFAEQNPQYALIATEIEGFNSQGLVSGYGKACRYHIYNGMVAEHLLFDNWLQTSTVMVRRASLLHAGGFDEDVGQFGEDWLLWMRIAAEEPIYFLPAALVRYRVHETSLTSWMPELQYESLMRILDRLALLQCFRTKPHLVCRARYRVLLGRGRANLRQGRYVQAIEKFQTAFKCARLPGKALAFWLLARLLLRVAGKGGTRAFA